MTTEKTIKPRNYLAHADAVGFTRSTAPLSTFARTAGKPVIPMSLLSAHAPSWID